MQSRKRPGAPAAPPSQQLAGFIAKFTPEVAGLIRQSRRALRARLPTAVEIVYDNYNALAIGFGSTERVSDVIVSLAAYARGVNLYFMYGARLKDPDRLLKGSGNQGRFVPLASPTEIASPGIDALIGRAVALGKVPLPETGRGRLVIKSISAKQRPRR